MTENCLEIENVLKFESLEVCKRRKSSLKRVALQITKIQISVSRNKNVCLFGVITKTSVLSDKNVPLPNNYHVEICACVYDDETK